MQSENMLTRSRLKTVHTHLHTQASGLCTPGERCFMPAFMGDQDRPFVSRGSGYKAVCGPTAATQQPTHLHARQPERCQPWRRQKRTLEAVSPTQGPSTSTWRSRSWTSPRCASACWRRCASTPARAAPPRPPAHAPPPRPPRTPLRPSSPPELPYGCRRRRRRPLPAAPHALCRWASSPQGSFWGVHQIC